MTVNKKAWLKYIKTLDKINKAAARDIRAWIEENALDEAGNIAGVDKAFIDYCYTTVNKYADGAAAVAAEMYDAIAEFEKVAVPAAELAERVGYGEVAKTVNGVVKTSVNVNEMVGAVTRHVKKAACDTTLQNAARDRAQFAWIPNGDTCPFCIMLASRGWQPASRELLKNHKEHIHSNCDCQYAIRFSKSTKYEGYDPDKYQEMYEDADTSSAGMKDGHWQNLSTARLNGMRREAYAKNKEEINEQKRDAYQKRKELESSKAEEINVN